MSRVEVLMVLTPSVCFHGFILAKLSFYALSTSVLLGLLLNFHFLVGGLAVVRVLFLYRRVSTRQVNDSGRPEFGCPVFAV